MPRLFGSFLDGGTATQHDQLRQRQFLSARLRLIDVLLDSFQRMQDFGKFGRVVDLPFPLRREADSCAVCSSALVFSKATLIVQKITTDALLKSCRQGEIDLAILALPVPAKYLAVEELFEEELLLVLPPDHPLVEKKKIRLSDVEPYPFVLLDEAHCLSDNIASFCRQRSFQPAAVERTSQLAMVQELVSLVHEVSMIPAMARQLDQSDRRVYRSFTGRKPTRTIAVVWNPYRFQSRLRRAFRERLRR